MPHTVYKQHHSGNTAEARVASRLRSSSPNEAKRPTDRKASHAHAEHGTGPTRTISNNYEDGGGTFAKGGAPKNWNDGTKNMER